MRRLVPGLAIAFLPAAASASGMPQMDFHNPLTGSQILWMGVIMVVLYLALSRWGLPRMGAVLEHRAGVIGRDLEAARLAKAAADNAVREMNIALHRARAKAHAEIAEAVAAAKARAAAEAATANRRLDAQLAAADAQIAAAQAEAMAAIKPVAEQTAAAILKRLTGQPPGPNKLSREIDAALAARAV